MASTTVSHVTSYNIIPKNINIYPNYLSTYLSQLVVPNVVITLIFLSYFVRNKALRINTIRALKETILEWFD
jgi:hypothetical protein